MARRQITPPADVPCGDELPELTAQQMAFVKGILDGMTASDAYRAAYSTENQKPETTWAAASRLRNDTKVAAWLAAARMANLGSATVTLAGHVAELERLREIALKTGNVGAAVQAEQLRGKASGHYVEQWRDLTEPDPLAALRQLEKLSPELARKLADQHGIPWHSETAH